MRYNIIIGNKTFGDLTEEQFSLLEAALKWFGISFSVSYAFMQYDSKSGKTKYLK